MMEILDDDALEALIEDVLERTPDRFSEFDVDLVADMAKMAGTVMVQVRLNESYEVLAGLFSATLSAIACGARDPQSLATAAMTAMTATGVPLAEILRDEIDKDALRAAI